MVKEYIYWHKYKKGEDIAVLKAESVEEAQKLLQEYYTEVSSRYIQEIDFSKRATPNIFIVSDY